MNPSDSFDPASVPQRYEYLADIEFLTQEGLAQERLTQENFSSHDLAEAPADFDVSPSDSDPLSPWQDQLLPFSCIEAEDNVTVLRIELEKAHQLLRYQQGVMDTLNEKLTNRDLNLHHTQEVLAQTQQICDRQTTKISELEAICRDFKVQLRRQQQRVLKYRNNLNEQTTLNSILLPTMQPSMQPTMQSATYSSVSVGYESISIESSSSIQPEPVSIGLKPPPVSAWSAPESIDLTGPLACYRKLAMIRMTSTTLRMDNIPLPGTSNGSVHAEGRSRMTHDTHDIDGIEPRSESNPPTPQNFRIELPTFTQSSNR